MAYKQRNNPFNRPATSSLNMSSAFKVAPANPENPRSEEDPPVRQEEDIYDSKGNKLEEGDTSIYTHDAEGNLSAEDNLAIAAARMENAFIDTENPQKEDGSMNYVKEGMAPQKDYIENTLFADVNYTEAWDDEAQEMRPVDSTKDAWSAAAVSNLAKAFDPEFEGSAQHAQFINRAFQGEGNYFPTKLNRKNSKDLQIGDILFKGRGDGPQKYRQFKNAAEDGWNDNPTSDGYKSHSDIIVDSYEKGGETYFVVQGGNIGDTLTNKTYTAKQLRDKYAGRLTQ